MQTSLEHDSLEEASADLLAFVLAPQNWVMLSELRARPELRPGQNPAYQRTVGKLRICASVDVTPTLDVFLRIAFRAPGLTPNRAADHLAEFISPRIPLLRNSEWQVQVDSRGWTHFMRRYAGTTLEA
ncbi:MAG: hypothetical protein IRZ16_09775 [Myxococcaceae bacterium]|nr:hypothetical protein [Myxococcaceae bacterium]